MSWFQNFAFKWVNLCGYAEAEAADAVVAACMAHSFEPNYAMVFVGQGFDVATFAARVLERMPRKRRRRPLDLIGCVAAGLIGPDAGRGEGAYLHSSLTCSFFI
jgi:hypothetical protein